MPLILMPLPCCCPAGGHPRPRVLPHEPHPHPAARPQRVPQRKGLPKRHRHLLHNNRGPRQQTRVIFFCYWGQPKPYTHLTILLLPVSGINPLLPEFFFFCSFLGHSLR